MIGELQSQLCRIEPRPRYINVGPARPLRNVALQALRLLPWPHVADFPPALVDAAALALQPGLRARAHIARQEVAAHEAVLRVGRGDRRDGPARTRLRVLPWDARRLAVDRQRLGRGGTRIGKVGL